MKTLIHKKMLLFVVLIGFAISSNAISQPAEFARERMETLKLVKILEILDLKEDEADKFIGKYKSLEKAVKDKSDKLEILNDELRLALKKDANDKEIKELTDKFLVVQNEFFMANMEKLKSMQSFLNQQNYAKFLIFEMNFHKKLRNMLMDFNKKKGGPDFEGEDGPPMKERKRRK